MSSLSAEKAARAEPEMRRACIYSKSVLFSVVTGSSHLHHKQQAHQGLHCAASSSAHFKEAQVGASKCNVEQFVGMGTPPFSLHSD